MENVSISSCFSVDRFLFLNHIYKPGQIRNAVVIKGWWSRSLVVIHSSSTSGDRSWPSVSFSIGAASLALLAAFTTALTQQKPRTRRCAGIHLSNTPPIHQHELWRHIFYIITDIESMDVLIKGSEYWVGAPTGHQLFLPWGVDSHNPLEE